MSSENDSSLAGNSAAGNEQERRSRHDLRQLFEPSCRITVSFFDPELGWGSTSLTLYARQTLRDAYPHLTQQEVAILFSAVERFHHANNKK